MIKIIRKNILLFLLFILTIIIISNCAKPECKISADCTPRTCYLSACEDKKCVYTSQRNCCGNRLNESIESGKPGNQCTCPQDYGKCEGKVKIKIGSRMEDSAYVHYFCNADNKCVFGVDKNDISQQNFLDAINVGFFKASSVVRYNKPFDVGNDNFEFRIILDDASKDLVLPVKLTKAKLLFSSEYVRIEQLIADKDIDIALNQVGEQATISVPLNLNYRPKEVEEIGSFRYSIDYTYTKKVLSGKAPDGTSLYNNEQVRATYSSPSKPVYVVRTE